MKLPLVTTPTAILRRRGRRPSRGARRGQHWRFRHSAAATPISTVLVGVRRELAAARRRAALLRGARRRAHRHRRRQDIAVATREAVLGDDLATLDRDRARAAFAADIETERTRARRRARACISNAIRQIMRHLRPDAAARRAPTRSRDARRAPTPKPTSDDGARNDALVSGVRLRGERRRRWLREGEPSTARQPRADRRARLDHRHADADRRLRRPLARPRLRIRACSGPRRLLMLGVALGCWFAWRWMNAP